EAGDELAVELIDEAVDAVGTTVASVTTLLDLELVVLGGGMGERLGPQLAPRIESTAKSLMFAKDVALRVVATQLGDAAGAVRAAGVKAQLAAGLGATAPDGLSPVAQLEAVRARVETLVERESRVFLDDIVPALAEAGIRLSDWDSLDDDDREHMVRVFEERI